ncbi:MAG TPA: hypothetical protein VJQ25_09900 [Nitrospira sp.]|jgi:hypothetical protein|nr:hypothetical protein [Nitrospira sp.]
MRPWIDRATLSSSALEYIGNLILNVLIGAGLIFLLIAGTFFIAS